MLESLFFGFSFCHAPCSSMHDRYCFAFLRNNRLFLGFTFFRFFFIQFSRYTWRWAFRVLGSSRFLSTDLPSLLVFGRTFLIPSYRVREMPPAQLVGSSGLEPPTSRLSGVRSNHLSYEPMSVAVRGPAIPAYLLSVVTLPFALSSSSRRSHCVAALFFRLNTSYSVREMPPVQPVVEMNRIELSTPCLQGRCSPS